ncbi:LPS export ABC transporter protein LptC [Tenacibaculum adriaticum]|uniref:LPS export ABC transporter protein LptC n=1 Tax=Tenacibaculum adriaticum TaxID=413713 RepID=A0A5S5DQC8_9FLAO|nr:LPS export ABC transporter periplasmic protein LptC [Tenacibaculum adriaticum]TYP97884.1 LPS export ABC transporter protein LptC [Tenacibaculum adriaticum]
MKIKSRNIYNSIATICLVAMFFSCTNNTLQVRDFLADKNMPIGIAKNTYHVYKDSGRITSKLITSLLYDFSNRKEHPYNEFPEGVKIVMIDKNGKDSTTVTGNYALSYTKTSVSEIKGNVVIINHTDKVKLETNQLFWDQKEAYFFTEDGFRLTTPRDTINGFGFEAKQDLTKWIAKDITGNLQANQKEL